MRPGAKIAAWLVTAGALVAGHGEAAEPDGFARSADALAGTSITIDEHIERRRIEAHAVAPDGSKSMVQVVAADLSRNEYENRWYLFQPDVRGATAFVFDGGGVELSHSVNGVPTAEIVPSTARWSPSSRYVAVLKRARVGEPRQIWLLDTQDRSQRPLTSGTRDIVDVKWGNDDRTLYYDEGPDLAALQREFEAHSTRGFLYRDDDYPAKIAQWYPGACGAAESKCRTSMHRLDLQSGLSAAVARDDLTRIPKGIRDTWHAKTAAAEGSGRGRLGAARLGLRVLENGDEASAVHCRSSDCQGAIREVRWTPEGSRVVFLRAVGHRASRTSLSVWTPASGAVREILQTEDELRDCAFVARRLHCVRATWTHPDHLVSIDLRDGAMRIVADPNDRFARARIPKVEKIERRDSSGNEIVGHFVHASLVESGKPPPLVVVSYGFRGFLESVGDEHAILTMSAAGMAVLFYSIPFDEPREFASEREETAAIWRTPRADGLRAIIDELIARKLVDEHAIGISGLSMGASLVDEAISTSERFVAASAGYSNTNPATYPFGSAEIRAIARLEEGGRFPMQWTESSRRIRNSPGIQSERIRTALLLNVADRELTLALPNYVLLRDSGKPVEMHVYRNEFHVKVQPLHRRSVMQRNLQWFQFWLAGTESDEPVDEGQYARWRRLRELREKDLAR